MKVNDLFLKDIYRNIEGVITASKASDEQIYQELDEYVVTKELQGHFKTFFDAYKKGILGDTSKMGVWIQGFFGSGKSHFLKILSYILENKEINGKTALDFFTEGDEFTRKIKDDLTIADMMLAVNVPTNVILFNIESKHQTGIEEKNSLVNVFLKVFNDSLGYSTIPQLADLERNLDKQGKFGLFKVIFEEIHGESWVSSRHEIDFLEDEIVKTLVKVEFFSESAARNWFIKYESDYKISIEEFAQLVEEYLQAKGNNEHIVFLVDEIGQYIGGNRSLTLQLQTIVEELGNRSRGKAWVIVTSQELIDAVTDISGSAAKDFSKIKGRFETTLSLSSANADEVIQERILKKNINGQQYLEADYPNHENNIKLMLQFEDSPELKLYKSAKNYADVYPFIPYQFNLVANILTQISKHSIQGTNLSRGERSLLAFFKETGERNAENDTNVLISLDQFYPSLEKWLNETKNDAVIKRALENSRIVPHPDDTFNVDVLKVLFMIKYVDQNVKPTLNNLTNLMIRRVDEDKVELRKRIEVALKILIHENLIRQNLKSYIFQTDEEQEVTRLINNIELSPSDIQNKLAVDIFDDKVGKNSFSYRNKNAAGKRFENRYIFNYNRYIDDYMYGRRINPQLEVKVITPLLHEIWGDETQLTLRSTKNTLLINLPADNEFMENLRTYLKVDKYVSTTLSNHTIKNFPAVKAEKSAENQTLNDSLSMQLDNLLRGSTFFFNNNQLNVVGSDFKSRLNDALQQMTKLVYHKNELVDAPITESDINKYLVSNNHDMVSYTENQNVIEEVSRFIALQSNQNMTVTMRTLRDNFVGKEPYGFINEDLEWAIVRLFKEGNLSLIKNGIPLSTSDNIKEISTAIFDRRTPEKIRVGLLIKIGGAQKKLVKELGEELFESKNIVDENNDDMTRRIFTERTERMISEFNNYGNQGSYHYPQSSVITQNLKLLHQIIETRDVKSFFDVLTEKEEELFEWAEELIDIRSFHRGNQKEIWKKATDYVALIEKSTLQHSTTEIDTIVNEMKIIMKKVIPYRDIPKLSNLNNKFQNAYTDLMEKQAKIALSKVKLAKEIILEDLEQRSFFVDYQAEVVHEFNQLIEGLEKYNRLDQIELAPIKASNLQKYFIDKFTEEENRRRIEEESKKKKNPGTEPLKPSTETSKVTYKKLETIYLHSFMKPSTHLNNEAEIDLFLNSLKKTLLEKLTGENELDLRP